MAVREFDSSVSDDIVTAIGALSAMQYGTVGGIVKVVDTGNLKTLLGLHDSGGSAQLSLGLDFNEFNYWWVHGSERVEGQQLTAGTWYVWIIRKDTGNLVPRSSLRDMTAGTWDHGGVNNDVIDSVAPGAGGDTRLSTGGSNFFDGRIAIRAAWSNSLPWAADAAGDSAIEAAGLETAASNWDAASPSAGWLFNQSSTSENIADFTGGGADQTSITGTMVITGDDPPGFSFDLNGGETVTFDGTLPALIGDFAITAAADVQLAGTLPGLTADFSIAAEADVQLSGTLSALVGDFNVQADATVQFAGQLPALIGSFTISEPNTVVLDGVLPALAGDFTLESSADVTLSGTLPALEGSFIIVQPDSVTLNGVLPALTGSFAVESSADAALAGILPALEGSFTIVTPGTVVLDGILPALIGSFTIEGASQLRPIQPFADARPQQPMAATRPIQPITGVP